MADLGMALLVVAMLAVGLAAALHSQRQALNNVNTSQKAQDLAQRALARLQTAQSRPTLDQGETKVQVEPLKQTPAPPQQTWVRLIVHHQGRRAELTGLVPTSVLEEKK